MEKIEIKMDGTQREMTIRTGEAPKPLPLRAPEKIVLSGDIFTPGKFVEKRTHTVISGMQTVHPERAIVLIHSEKKYITLMVDPENELGAAITGALETPRDLEAFGINTTKLWSREELAKLIKFSRIHFDSREVHAKVLDSIAKVRIKTETELQMEKDNRGNKAMGYAQSVINDNGLVREFSLFMPVFKGLKKEKFQVELCFDVSGGSVCFWLESPELKELQEETAARIMDSEAQRFQDFVIIVK
jgi:hypothetical protein